MYLEQCECGAYSGLQHKLRLGGPYPLPMAVIKIARCPHVETTGWGKGGAYDAFALLINADLWDLLHSGLGLAEDVVHCSMCSKFDQTRSFGGGSEMVAARLCCTCFFWREQLANRNENCVVCDGRHFRIGKGKGPADCRGHGGAGFRIRFFDGREVVTHDLWANGDIPDAWRVKFPDNATIERADETPQAYVGPGAA